MQQTPHDVYANSAIIDLLEILYWRVFGMGEDCIADSHVNKYEVMSLLEDAQEALKGN